MSTFHRKQKAHFPFCSASSSPIFFTETDHFERKILELIQKGIWNPVANTDKQGKESRVISKPPLEMGYSFFNLLWNKFQKRNGKWENCILPRMQEKCLKYPIYLPFLRDVDSFVLLDDVNHRSAFWESSLFPFTSVIWSFSIINTWYFVTAMDLDQIWNVNICQTVHPSAQCYTMV